MASGDAPAVERAVALLWTDFCPCSRAQVEVSLYPWRLDHMKGWGQTVLRMGPRHRVSVSIGGCLFPPCEHAAGG